MRPWGREAILDAIADWYDSKGRLPTFDEWEIAAPGRPAARTVERYGTWLRMLAEAIGINVEDVPAYQLQRPHRPRAPSWDPDAMIAALVAEHERSGHWPTYREWERATAEHPSARHYAKAFKRWDAALAVAAFEQRRRKMRYPAKR